MVPRPRPSGSGLPARRSKCHITETWEVSKKGDGWHEVPAAKIIKIKTGKSTNATEAPKIKRDLVKAELNPQLGEPDDPRSGRY